ncbi:MAG: phosphoribosyltransferase domain-containing protein [Methylobacter sp.]|nr:phosphoribosyltransferase domain-containing protein [Methylobacter sp.]
MSKTVTVTLDTGILHLDIDPGHIPLNRLLGFAARVSSKRKFLLVSKVLGKHYPVSPKLMSWSYRALARMVLNRGAGAGSLWIGMAETATGLGYGVFEAACREGAEQALFIQTTRYHLDGIQRLEFEEAHSHATDFFLYFPERRDLREQFLTAQTLVLIDDEISTGKTFLRLIKAYQQVNPGLQKVFIVSLVNFAHPDDRASLENQSGVAVEWLCFRQGLLRFEDSQNVAIDNITVNVSGNGGCKKALLAWPGRLGLDAPISLETDVFNQLCSNGFCRDQATDSRPILVLGTGECNAPAYLLGRELEGLGFKVKVQSTTRSPIHLGNDIGLVSQFKDNYNDDIPNFIYNLNPDDYRDIILCHETPLCASLNDRLQAWQAISARFEMQPNILHPAKLHFFKTG